VDYKRGRVYCWPTWITKLLSGEERCWWRAWFRAHTKYEKIEDDPERAEFFREWNRKHDAIVARRAAELKAAGWTVKIEDEGQFKVAGDLGDLAGKPDIVAMKGDEAVVIDAKAGRRRGSDHWQVLLYIFALPLSWLKGFKLRGEVEYHDGREATSPMTPEAKERIISAMKKVMGPEAPESAPSRNECRYCDVKTCPTRWADTGEEDGDARGMF
jgi:hypothetical protein